MSPSMFRPDTRQLGYKLGEACDEFKPPTDLYCVNCAQLEADHRSEEEDDS